MISIILKAQKNVAMSILIDECSGHCLVCITKNGTDMFKFLLDPKLTIGTVEADVRQFAFKMFIFLKNVVINDDQAERLLNFSWSKT